MDREAWRAQSRGSQRVELNWVTKHIDTRIWKVCKLLLSLKIKSSELNSSDLFKSKSWQDGVVSWSPFTMIVKTIIVLGLPPKHNCICKTIELQSKLFELLQKRIGFWATEDLNMLYFRVCMLHVCVLWWFYDRWFLFNPTKTEWRHMLLSNNAFLIHSKDDPFPFLQSLMV